MRMALPLSALGSDPSPSRPVVDRPPDRGASLHPNRPSSPTATADRLPQATLYIAYPLQPRRYSVRPRRSSKLRPDPAVDRGPDGGLVAGLSTRPGGADSDELVLDPGDVAHHSSAPPDRGPLDAPPPAAIRRRSTGTSRPLRGLYLGRAHPRDEVPVMLGNRAHELRTASLNAPASCGAFAHFWPSSEARTAAAFPSEPTATTPSREATTPFSFWCPADPGRRPRIARGCPAFAVLSDPDHAIAVRRAPGPTDGHEPATARGDVEQFLARLARGGQRQREGTSIPHRDVRLRLGAGFPGLGLR